MPAARNPDDAWGERPSSQEEAQAQSAPEPSSVPQRPVSPVVIPPSNPFSGWMFGGVVLFLVAGIAAIVCFVNSGDTETSGYGLGSTTVDVVYADVLAGGVALSVLSAAGVVVAVIAQVGTQIFRGQVAETA
ncbi:MAG: hypothetical protein ACTH1D_08470 [Mycobacteriaceae bacterium]|uniref:hypothetical protein n=1 Tax=Corynebacterium sp. TaxID=1720 RepID=UPI003F9AFFEB